MQTAPGVTSCTALSAQPSRVSSLETLKAHVGNRISATWYQCSPADSRIRGRRGSSTVVTDDPALPPKPTTGSLPPAARLGANHQLYRRRPETGPELIRWVPAQKRTILCATSA